MEKNTNKINWMLLLIVMLGLVVFGIIKKQTYISIIDQKSADPYDKITVGCMPEDYAEGLVDSFGDLLIYSNIILKVEILSDPVFFYRGYGYDVSVKQVFNGSELAVGDEFFLTKGSWTTFFEDEEPYALNLGFTNFLQKGEDYLVFIDSKVDTLDDSLVYALYDYTITPAYCYTDGTSTPAESDFNDQYSVYYNEVKNSEFFGENEASIEKMYELKKMLISQYQ
jgi:hypothetical protein